MPLANALDEFAQLRARPCAAVTAAHLHIVGARFYGLILFGSPRIAGLRDWW